MVSMECCPVGFGLEFNPLSFHSTDWRAMYGVYGVPVCVRLEGPIQSPLIHGACRGFPEWADGEFGGASKPQQTPFPQ